MRIIMRKTIIFGTVAALFGVAAVAQAANDQAKAAMKDAGQITQKADTDARREKAEHKTKMRTEARERGDDAREHRKEAREREHHKEARERGHKSGAYEDRD
jgi:nucleosome binding factor SPN SPT16 subunit